MKVIFCLKYFLPDRIAGTEIYVSGLCHQLQKLGVETVVVKPNYSSKTISEYFYNDIRVVEYPESHNVTKGLQKGNIFPKGISVFKKIIQNEQPDIVHFHEVSGSNGITIQHLREVHKMGIEVFTTLHLSGYVCKNNSFLYKGLEKCDGKISVSKCATCLLHTKGLKYGLADAVVKVSGFLNLSEEKSLSIFNYRNYILRHKKQLKEIFSISSKVFVLSNWFKNILLINDLPGNKIELVRQAYSGAPLIKSFKTFCTSKEVRLIYLGRITKIKGLHIVLKALVGFENIHLDVYGVSNDKDYENECKKLALGNSNISWKGSVQPPDVVSTISKYDALILPSIVEEMAPLIIQEAFAANVPVIGSNCAGVSEEIIHNMNGLLFKMNNAESLKKVFQQVSEDFLLIKSLKGNIELPRTFEDVAINTMRIYSSLLTDKPVPVS